MPRPPKAQSTVEYLIVVASVIFVVFVFLRPGGLFRRAYDQTINKSLNKVQQDSETLFPLNASGLP